MKIHSLDLLALIAAELRKQDKIVVLANGCFDVLHVGHIKHLEAARTMGNCLMVTVTSDKFARKQKGPDHPYFPIRQRLEALAALACVSYVTMNVDVPGEAIRMIKPAIYVKGREYRGNITPELGLEKMAVAEYGGRLVFTDTAEWHSSEIVKKLDGPTLSGGS